MMIFPARVRLYILNFLSILYLTHACEYGQIVNFSSCVPPFVEQAKVIDIKVPICYNYNR